MTHPYIGRLECHPVYKAKQGYLDAKTRRYRRFVRLDWQIRVNHIIARNAHDHRTVKPSTTRFKSNMARFK